jgi:hypothetical protein
MSGIAPDPYATPPTSPVPSAASLLDGPARTVVDDLTGSEASTILAGQDGGTTEAWPDSISLVQSNVGQSGEEFAGPTLDISKAENCSASGRHPVAMWLANNDEVKAFCSEMKADWKKDTQLEVGWNSETIALAAVVKEALKETTPPHSMVLHEFVKMAWIKKPPSSMSNGDWQGLCKECMETNPDRGKPKK